MADTRKDLEKQAKAVGIKNPEEYPSREAIKEAVEVETGAKGHWYYPEHDISVTADNRESADKELADRLEALKKIRQAQDEEQS